MKATYLTARRYSQKPAARVALAFLVGALAALLAVSGVPNSALAQEEEEQPKETGPAIKLLNPSDFGEFTSVSERDMEEGHGFHLTAWVRDVPKDPKVLFEIESASAGRRRIGLATQEGPDTFGLHWHLPESGQLANGSYTVKATLFSQGAQVAEDSVGVFLSRNFPTVTIDHPSLSGHMGVYLPTAQGARWNTIIDYTFSSGTQHVTFFYTVTSPGEQPEWTNCGSVRVSTITIPSNPDPTAGAPEPGSRRHLCELETDHDGREVTAVAAVASDIPAPLARTTGDTGTADAPLFGDTSGDAHRVFPYRQVPENINLRVEGPEPGLEGPRQYEVGQCTNQILAFVSDQNDRPMARVNVDVLGTGPEATAGLAALRFDVSTGGSGTDANQAPDKNVSDTTPARNCSNSTSSGTQGNHRQLNGPDTRHIESAAAGTNVDGRFRFRLYNDQPGVTQVTAWVDLDDEDQRCTRETAGHLTLGWDQEPPLIAPHGPKHADCPDLDEVLGITHHKRSIGMTFAQRGGSLLVRGPVKAKSGRRSCISNVVVNVQRQAGGEWKTVRNTLTNKRGNYTASVPNRKGVYRTVAVETFTGAENEHVCDRAAKRAKYRG
jgi:hypothetical protein